MAMAIWTPKSPTLNELIVVSVPGTTMEESASTSLSTIATGGSANPGRTRRYQPSSRGTNVGSHRGGRVQRANIV